MPLYADDMNNSLSVMDFSILIYQKQKRGNSASLTDFREILNRLPKNLSDKLTSLSPDTSVTRKILVNTLSYYLNTSVISDILNNGHEEDILNKKQIRDILDNTELNNPGSKSPNIS